MTFDDLLARIRRDNRLKLTHYTINGPLTQRQLDQWRLDHPQYTLPEEYLDILRKANGVEPEGRIDGSILPLRDIRWASLEMYDNSAQKHIPQSWLALIRGPNSDAYIVLDAATGKYLHVTTPGVERNPPEMDLPAVWDWFAESLGPEPKPLRRIKAPIIKSKPWPPPQKIVPESRLDMPYLSEKTPLQLDPSSLKLIRARQEPWPKPETMEVLDLETGRLLASWPGWGAGSPFCGPDTLFVRHSYPAKREAAFRHFNVCSGQITRDMPMAEWASAVVCPDHTTVVVAEAGFQRTPDGGTVPANPPPRLLFYDTASLELIATVPLPEGLGWFNDASRGGDLAVIIDGDTARKIFVIHLEPTPSCISLELSRRDLFQIRCSPDGRHFAVSYDNGVVHIYNRQGEPVCVLHNPIKATKEDPFGAGGGMTWSPRGDQLLTSNGPLLRLWNAADWTLAASNLDMESSERHWLARFGPEPDRLSIFSGVGGWHLTRFTLAAC